MRKIDVPGQDVIAPFSHEIGLVVLGVDGFNVFGGERKEPEAVGCAAPIAVEALCAA
jgi:hypothetical protein